MTPEILRYKCEHCGRLFVIEEEAIAHEKRCFYVDRTGKIFRSSDGGVAAVGKRRDGSNTHEVTEVCMWPDLVFISKGGLPPFPYKLTEISFSEFTDFCEEAKAKFNEMVDLAFEKAKEWIEDASWKEIRRIGVSSGVVREQHSHDDPDSMTMTCPSCGGKGCSYCMGAGKVSKRIVL